MDRPGCFHGANAEDDVLSMLDNVFSSRATLNFDREFTFFSGAGYLLKKLAERNSSLPCQFHRIIQRTVIQGAPWGTPSSKALTAGVLGFGVHLSMAKIFLAFILRKKCIQLKFLFSATFIHCSSDLLNLLYVL